MCHGLLAGSCHNLPPETHPFPLFICWKRIEGYKGFCMSFTCLPSSTNYAICVINDWDCTHQPFEDREAISESRGASWVVILGPHSSWASGSGLINGPKSPLLFRVIVQFTCPARNLISKNFWADYSLFDFPRFDQVSTTINLEKRNSSSSANANHEQITTTGWLLA